MNLQDKLLKQFRKPSGWLGRLNVRDMNRRHSDLTDWGLQQLTIKADDTILDVGCGGGRTVQKLAAMAPNGKVYGVDFSQASVDASRRLNRQSIGTRHVDIRLGPVSKLPFSDQTFDLVTAVETHFYWPDLPNDVREVMRVLKPGGIFMIITEAYKGGKLDQKIQIFAAAMKPLGYSHLTVDEHRELFLSAGYSEVRVSEDYDKGWLAVMGKRPT